MNYPNTILSIFNLSIFLFDFLLKPVIVTDMTKKSKSVRPKWSDANSNATLQSMGMIHPKHRKENNDVAKFLKSNGYSFWDSMCIADYDHHYNGYTLLFRKKLECSNFTNPYLYFSLYWVNDMSVHWNGQFRCFYNFPSATGENNPMTMLEVERITAYNMGMLPTYETTLVRALAHMYSWTVPTTPDARWKIPTEESN